MSRSDPQRVHVVLFDRRKFLKLAAAAGGVAAAQALLPGCDVLVLPEVQLLDQLPDIVPNEDFYVQSAFGTPDENPDHTCVLVDDDGNSLGSFDQAFVDGLTARVREHTLQCIGANPRFLFIGNALWTGLPFREVLDLLGVVVPAGATWMRITGADEYATGLPISDIDGTDGRDPMWLVWLMNGEPLPRRHGAPFRFLVPGRYGTKNPKWPTEVAFVNEEFIGHWESRGWSQEATYQTNGLILSPPTMAVVGAGSVRIVGSAFSGHVAIDDVEVTTDGGDTWQPAEITYTSTDSETPGDDTDVHDNRHIWTTWRYDWQLDEPGEYIIQIRVTDETGHVTDLDPAGTDRFNGYNAGMEIHVTVS